MFDSIRADRVDTHVDMMNSQPKSSDLSLLDLDDITSPEEWRSLIYNKIVRQKDFFIGNIKNAVISDITVCIQNARHDITLESLKNDIINIINENQFECIFKKFVDGLVGESLEFVCQFSIKNSMDNIKRTQSALNSIMNIANTPIGEVKSCCNEDNQLQETSKLIQVQCLSESNDNATDTSKVINSHLFNSCLQNNAESLAIMEKENFDNIIVNTTDNTCCLHTYKHSQSTNNSSMLVELDHSNEVNIENNYLNNAHPSDLLEGEDEEDLRTNQAIMSLALKISQQNINFNYSDEFDDDQIINCTASNAIKPTSFCVVENGVIETGGQNMDTNKLDEEINSINNSLKILESLVNIEHNKLENQKSLTEHETQQPNVEVFENNQSTKSNTANLNKKRNKRSKNKEYKIVDKEELIKKHESSYLKHLSKKQNIHKEKSSKNNNRKLEDQNNLNNLSSSANIEDYQNVLLDFNDSAISSSSKNSEATTFSIASNNTLDTFSTIGSNGYNTPPIKLSPIASTSSYNEIDVDNLKNNLSSISGLPMKTSDYKKIYEKDRKNLFSPDIIIVSKPTKDSPNNLCAQKEYNAIEQKSIDFSSIKKNKSKKSKLKENNNFSDNKKMNRDHNHTKDRRTNGKLKKSIDIDSVIINTSSSSSSSSSIMKSSNSTTVNCHNKFKRLKAHKHNDEIQTNSETNINPLSNISDNENKDTVNLETLENPLLENRKNLVNYESNTVDTALDDSLPNWMKNLFVLHNIKPLYVVIDPNVKYIT